MTPSTPASTLTEREQFEAWAVSEEGDFDISTIRNEICDITAYAYPRTFDAWRAWKARAALTLSEPVEAAVWTLLFPGDARLNLSTVFDTEAEAKDYVERCTSRPTVVPLYRTPPAIPVSAGVVVGIVDGDEASRRILWADVAAFDYPVGTKLYAAVTPPEAAASVQEEDNMFWLIERGSNQGQSPTCWRLHTGASPFEAWTFDATKAHRFAHKQDAEKCASYLEKDGTYAITSHSMIGATPVAPADFEDWATREMIPHHARAIYRKCWLVAANGSPAEAALRRVLEVVQRYLPPDGPSVTEAMSEIIAIVDPWPLATPVVQGEPRKIGRIIINELGHPFAVLYTSFDEAGEVWKDGAPLYATPAPSPKEPTDWIDKLPYGEGMTAMKSAIRAALATRGPIGAATLNWDALALAFTSKWSGADKVEAGDVLDWLMAFPKGGPIGAVEPSEETESSTLESLREWIDRTFTGDHPRVCGPWRKKEVFAALDKAILALSRTPGAGNAD